MSTGQGLLDNNMFAYCQNNPVIHSDHSGYLTDGQIHDKVLELIARKSGYRYKYLRQDTLIIYTISFGLKWFGFCDLYDPYTGEVWELKKNTARTSCTTAYAQKQLDRYITYGLLMSDIDLELKYPTSSIPAGFFTEVDSTGTQYYISYWDQGGGILRYQYIEIPSKYEIIAATTIACVFVASVQTQSGGGRARQNYYDN